MNADDPGGTVIRCAKPTVAQAPCDFRSLRRLIKSEHRERQLPLLQGTIEETTAYNLWKVDQQGFHWIQVPLLEKNWEGNKEPSAAKRARVSIPIPFASR